MKYILIFLGIFFIILGIIGLFFPVLPTVPFLLLSSICFSKGSARFEKWFKGTLLYKKFLENYIKERSISLFSKIRIITLTTIMLTFSIILIDNIYARIFILMVLLVHYYVFIFKIKTKKKEKKLDEIEIN